MIWQTWLDTHWQSRLAGDLAPVRHGLAEVELRLGIDTSVANESVLEQLVGDACTVTQAADVVLLRVSLLRRDVNTRAACEMADHVGLWLKKKRVAGSFQYYLQRGLNALAQSNRIGALDEFLAARKIAVSPMQQLFAGINLVLALEDLGFEYEVDLMYLQPLIVQCANEPWIGSIVAEHDALLARTAYRHGDALTLNTLCQKGIRGDQASYFLTWVTDLPFFHAIPAATEARRRALAFLAGRHRDGYLVGYELRTLQRMALDEDDTADVRSTEHIERLYAWCWRWLVAPGSQDLSRLMATKNSLFGRLIGVLTVDEYLQLECALRWLAFFAGVEDSVINVFTRDLSYPAGRPVPILDYEKMFLDWLNASRTHNDELARERADALRQHSMAQVSGFGLCDLVTSCIQNTAMPVTDQPWGNLRASIRDVLEPLPDHEPGVVVDALTCEIHRCHQGTIDITRSHSLARLMQLAARGDSFPAGEAMQAAFGIPRYEEERHEQKLAKILVQANKSGSPWVRFVRRGTRVFVDGERQRIRLCRANAHVSSWMAQEDPTQVLLYRPATAVAIHPEGVSPAILSGDWRTRSEIQTLIGCSKTVAVQRIQLWLELGKLERKGEGKASRYRMLGDLEKEIINSRKTFSR